MGESHTDRRRDSMSRVRHRRRSPITALHKPQHTFSSSSPVRSPCSLPPDKPVLVQGVHRPGAKVHGFGLEGDAATVEMLLLIMQERPADVEQLLAGQRTQVRGERQSALAWSHYGGLMRGLIAKHTATKCRYLPCSLTYRRWCSSRP